MSGGQACSWTGTWAAQNGPDLMLTQTGSQVTGSFGYHGHLDRHVEHRLQ
jgi:hypothetical protein